MKTLKQVARALRISETKASRIKRKIEEELYPGVPSFMVWGYGEGKRYNLKTFREYL